MNRKPAKESEQIATKTQTALGERKKKKRREKGHDQLENEKYDYIWNTQLGKEWKEGGRPPVAQVQDVRSKKTES